MSSIAIIDTSIVLNVLDIPNMNQDRSAVLSRFGEEVRSGTNILLPMAVIVETGNHIAHITDGNVRRDRAIKFVLQIQKALDGSAPWTPLPFPDKANIQTWLAGFPNMAMRGIGIGDLSIIELWKYQCSLFPMRRIFIWSIDNDLAGYDHHPPL